MNRLGGRKKQRVHLLGLLSKRRQLERRAPPLSTTGCIFCDLMLAPNQSGLHSSKEGSVTCTRVR